MSRHTCQRSGRRGLPAWHTETIDFDERRFQIRAGDIEEFLARDSRLVRRLRLRTVSPRFGYKSCAVLRLNQRAVLRRSVEPTVLAPQPLLLTLSACFDCGVGLESPQSSSPTIIPDGGIHGDRSR